MPSAPADQLLGLREIQNSVRGALVFTLLLIFPPTEKASSDGRARCQLG